MKYTLQIALSTTVLAFLATGCDSYTKPTPEDVRIILEKKMKAGGIKKKDLTVEELNCARDGAVFNCTFTFVSRDQDRNAPILGPVVFEEKFTRHPGAQMKFIKGETAWMEH